jgi:hypothetical protein
LLITLHLGGLEGRLKLPARLELALKLLDGLFQLFAVFCLGDFLNELVDGPLAFFDFFNIPFAKPRGDVG